MAESPLALLSDKFFWHGYVPFYEMHFPKAVDGLIVEFGVFQGNSIRWLMERYPAARIIGVDILPLQRKWPVDARVTYRQVDQGHEGQVAGFFGAIAQPVLIIEDGSHLPAHQSRCLRHGMKKLAPGGMYVLEDIHTSLPGHGYYQNEFEGGKEPPQTALSVLLALEQIRRTGRKTLSEEEIGILAAGTHFSREDIVALSNVIDGIWVYKRATLPTSCYQCGSTTFDYHHFKCKCGTPLMDVADSMSVVIRKRAS